MNPVRLTPAQVARLLVEDPAAPDELAEAAEARPTARAACVGVERPCPFLSCRHHLGADVSARGGLRLTWGGELPEGAETCALDVAELGGVPPEAVGHLLNCGRGRAMQIEAGALVKLRAALRGGR